MGCGITTRNGYLYRTPINRIMRKFWLDCLAATVFVFIALWGLDSISDLPFLNSLDPISQALEDIELTDYAFSKLRWEDPPVDTSIVIVNTGYLSRAEIAQQIMVISQFQPKIIALDIIFSCDGGLRDSVNCPQAYDTLSNLILSNAIQEAGTVVMAHKLWRSSKFAKENSGEEQDEQEDVFDSLEHSDANLRGNAYEGFVNLVTGANHQEDLKICRKFTPTVSINDSTEELSFSVKIAQLYDSVTTQAFLNRNQAEEVINYRGNIVDWHGASDYPGRYIVLDWDQALDASTFTPSLLKDKIVLLGFLGSDLRDTSWDDKFFTPLNKKFAGRARPDMYGIVVHANIISMILNRDYVDELPSWLKFVIAFTLCFLNIALFAWIFKHMPIWFDTLTIGLQIVQLLIVAALIPYVFYWFNYKLEITAALAALALAGPCFEIYVSIIKMGLLQINRKYGLTKKRSKVLSTQHTDIS